MITPKQKIRALSILLVMFAAFLGLSWRLAYLQVVKHDELGGQADATRTHKQILLARRGDIRDRNGALIATSVPVKTIFVDAQVWNERPPTPEIAAQFIRLLKLNQRELNEKLVTGKRYIVLQRKVSEDTVAKLRNLKIRSLGYENDYQRHYPLERSLCHVIGFVDFDHHGAQGVERTMELYLAGQAGWRISPRDNRGREIVPWRFEQVPAHDGDHVELTVDLVIQDIVESELDKVVKSSHPLNACAIAMHPRTGEILAIANWPTYTPNDPGSEPIANQKNIGIVNTFEPGSTFKIVPIAGALNDNTVSLQTVFNCGNGAWVYGGRTLRCSHAHGTINVNQTVQESCNICTAHIALKMGEKRLYHYIESFGFGSRTGIDLPAEVRGIVNPINRWSKLEITRIPMGQSIAVTPLQMVRAMSALANGGELMQPYIIRRIVSKDGAAIAQFRPQITNRPISKRAAAQMNQALKSVVTKEGTAQKAAIEEWTVAGKTGTAQKYENGQPSHTKFIASFIGYLPADNPQICIGVFVDEPKGVYYGGEVAAPVFRAMAERIVLHLNIPADNLGGQTLANSSKPKQTANHATTITH